MYAPLAVSPNAPEGLIFGVDVTQKCGETIIRQTQLVKVMNCIRQIITSIACRSVAVADELDHDIAFEFSGILQTSSIGGVSVRHNARRA